MGWLTSPNLSSGEPRHGGAHRRRDPRGGHPPAHQHQGLRLSPRGGLRPVCRKVREPLQGESNSSFQTSLHVDCLSV